MADSRSKKRLLIVTLVLLVVLGYFVFTSSLGSYSYFRTISEVRSHPSLVGKSVKVAGKVVKGSVEKNSKGYRFTIGDKGQTMAITYEGTLPATFGEGIQVIADGKLIDKEHLKAKSIITKCPSKYQSKVDTASKDGGDRDAEGAGSEAGGTE